MPRSPSRDLVDRFTGNRDYFHRADGLRRWKNAVALAALGLTLGWLIVEFAMPSSARSAHSHGELANPHAAFDANCQACHQSHSPGDFFSNPTSVFGTHDRWHDLTCTKCHAGPEHHKDVKQAMKDESKCSDCHHDHQGRDRSLVRIDDSHCTKCHKDLPNAHERGSPKFEKVITGFVKDHPEFKAVQAKEVERGLKFSHALHMTPGLVYDPNDQHKWTPEKFGERFGSDAKWRFAADASNSVQLRCGDCHQLDAGQGNPNFDLLTKTIRGASRQAILPARAEGAYYLPVNFDVHCKVCHPNRTPTAVSGNTMVKEFFVPHRRQPSALKDLLRGEYAARLAAVGNPLLAALVGPSGRLDPHDPTAPATYHAELDRLTNAAIQTLTQNLAPSSEHAPGGFACGKCHFSTGLGKTEVAAVPNKAIWFEHAKFNHVSHRGLTCASCHAGAEGAFSPGGTVNEREPVLIAGVKTCQACHAPAGAKVELPNNQTASAAGVRHSCTDCHRYHNGDRPMQGLGASPRDPMDPLDLREFLDGRKKQP